MRSKNPIFLLAIFLLFFIPSYAYIYLDIHGYVFFESDGLEGVTVKITPINGGCTLVSGNNASTTDGWGYYELKPVYSCESATIEVNVSAMKEGFYPNWTVFWVTDSVNTEKDFTLQSALGINISPKQQVEWSKEVNVVIDYLNVPSNDDLHSREYAIVNSDTCDLNVCYHVDQDEWVSADSNSVELTLNKDGSWCICGYVETEYDVVWEVGGPYRIDSILPTIQISLNNYITPTDRITVHYSASDNRGLSQLKISSNAGTTTVPLSGTQESGSKTIDLAEGWNDVYALCYDIAGNQNQSKTIKVCADTKSPKINLIWPTDHYVTDTSIVFKWNGYDEGCAGIEKYALYLNNNLEYNGSNTQYFTILNEGHYTWKVIAYDKAGNYKISESRDLIVDSTPPTTTITPNGHDWTNQSVSFTITCSDNLAGCDKTYYAIINASESCSNINVYHEGNSGQITQTGEWKVCYYSVDKAGNIEAVKESNVFRIDKEAPSVSLIEPTDGSWHNVDVTLKWQGTDIPSGIEKYEVYVDGSKVYEGPSTSYVYHSTAQNQGVHSWKVIAYDKTGNSGKSEEWKFGVDVEKPSITIFTPSCVNDDFDVHYQAADNIELTKLIITANSWTNIIMLSGNYATGSVTIPASSFGLNGVDIIHVIARVYDHINLNSISQEIDWDKAIPKIIKLQPNGNFYTNDTATFEWKFEDVGCAGINKVTLYVGGNAYPVGSEGSKTIQLNEGIYAWYFKVYDKLGNKLETTHYTVTVDKHAPSTTITPNGHDWTNQSVSFTITCSDNLAGCDKTYYAIINASESCSNINVYHEGNSGQITQTGEWKVCYYSVDKAGNIEAVKESNVFRIDKEAPSVGQAHANVYFDGNVYWAKPGDHVITYASASDQYSGIDKCWYTTYYGSSQGQFDGSKCVYEYDLPANSREVEFWFEVEDKAGNRGSGSSAVLKPDKVAPSLTINAPSGWVNYTISVKAICNDAESGCNKSTIRYYVNDSISSCPTDYSLYTYDSYTATDHVFVCAAAYDNVGNLGISNPAEIKVDLNAPSVGQTMTNVSYHEGYVYYTKPGKYVKAYAEASDYESGIKECTFNGQPASYVNGKCEYVFVAQASNFAQILKFKVYDNAGNSNTSIPASLVVDGIAPQIDINITPNVTVNGKLYVPVSASASIMASDDNFLNMTVNGTDYMSNSVSFPVPSTSGDYQIQVIARDKAGNENSTTLSYTVDAENPSVSITYDIDTAQKKVIFHITPLDNMAQTLRCEINGSVTYINNGTTYDYEASGQSGSNITINVVCYDYVNNSGSETKSVYVDWNAPKITLIEPANNSYGNKFVFNVSDEAKNVTCDVNVGSVIKRYEVQTNETFEVNASDFGLPDGTYNWNVTCNDSLNIGVSETRTVKLDTTGPNISIDAPSSVYAGHSFTINASLIDPAGVDSCKVKIDGNEIHSNLAGNNCIATTTINSVGTHTITIFANDTLGNSNSASKGISVMAVSGGGGAGGGGGAVGGGGTTCTADGYACNSSADCCSGLCLDGICARASEINFTIELPETINMLDNETIEVEVKIKNLAPFTLKNVAVSTNVGRLSSTRLDFNASEEKKITLTLSLEAGTYNGIIRVMKYGKSFEKEFTVVVENSSLLALKSEAEKSCTAAEEYATKLNNSELLKKVAIAKANIQAGNYTGAKTICDQVLAFKAPKAGAPGIGGLFIAAGKAGKVLARYWWIAAVAAAVLAAVLIKARKRELPRGFVEYEQTF